MSNPPKSQGPEPEIIPPDRTERDRPRVRVFFGTHGTERIYIGKPSPLGIIFVTLIIGLLSAAILVVFLGAFLLLLPLRRLRGRSRS